MKSKVQTISYPELLLEVFQNEDILTREQAWIQLKKPSLNTDLSEENLCGLWNRHKLRDKFISLNPWSYQE